MKNLTIKVEDDLARWAKVWAARQGTSVSRFVAAMLRRRMLAEEGYAAAMADYLSGQVRPLKEEEVYPSREELHERPDLR